MIKAELPLYNRRLRRHASLLTYCWDGSPTTAPRLVDTACLEFNDSSEMHGLFKSRSQAKKVLLEIADDKHLCHRWLGLERGKGACFRSQIGRCGGACSGAETLVQQSVRVHEGLSGLRLKAWPWPGPVAIRESCDVTGATELHVVDRWRYLGSYRDEQALQADLFDARPAFDIDTYKLLVSYLGNKKRPDVIPLPESEIFKDDFRAVG